MGRVAVLDEATMTRRGVLPTTALRFSVEVGGAGGLDFTAAGGDLDTLGGWDAVALVEVSDDADAGPWHPVALYALRPPHRRPRVAAGEVECTGVGLLEQWASETVLLPEYTPGTLPLGAGEERAIGWMMSAYDPQSDPAEAWDGCYNTSRTGKWPPQWPTSSGAKWISVVSATDESERKLFRAWLDLTGRPGPDLCRAWITSDESATLYVAGEPVAQTSSVETGYEELSKADIVLYPGLYAIAVDTQTDFTKGGDGVDPIAVAIAILDDDGQPQSWPLVSDAAHWVACRRDDEGPGSEPPGPTPGAAVASLVLDAAARGAAGWAAVSIDFTATRDSYGQPWPEPVVERQHRYALDSYWSILQALAETGELDLWLTADRVLHAAPAQGVDRSGTVTLGTAAVSTLTDARSSQGGTQLFGFTHDGWLTAAAAGPRREQGLELGTVLSAPVARRVLAAALADRDRWDGSVSLTGDGPRPVVDYMPGDWVTLDLPDPTLPGRVRVLSLSARAGDGGLLWDVELTDEEPAA